MARKVFFSFHYACDSWRVSQVRNCNVIHNLEKAPFLDGAAWEQIKRRGDRAVQAWIEDQLKGTSVTVVLVGAETANRRWVKYEIQRSAALGKGRLGINISGIRDSHGKTEVMGANPLPYGYPLYKWNADRGAQNMARWIEQAASKAGR